MAQTLTKKLGSFLRKKRGKLSYQQFAEKVGLSDSSLHRLEKGEQNVTLESLEQLAKKLRCSVSEMLRLK